MTDLQVGQLIECAVGAPAHGGACVARHEGRVVFVRHALPAERVRARVTAVRTRLAFADAVEVVAAAPDRVPPPCPLAGPGRCGGCDLQHVALPAQRAWKAAVVADQFRRLAGLDVPVSVQPVEAPGVPDDGLGWRTRTRFAVTPDGRLGLHRYRSDSVIEVPACPIGHAGLPPVTTLPWPRTRSVEAITSGSGERFVVVEPAGRSRPNVGRLDLAGAVDTDGRRLQGRTHLREQAAGRSWRVTGSGFWQVHPGAADAFAATVLELAAPSAGERVADLYSGVGLFAGVLAARVGADGPVVAVEADAGAVADARRNLHDLPQVRLVHARVDRALAGTDLPARLDVVVLDPPRTGAGAAVVRAIAGRAPRSVVYVACDPAALARDTATFAQVGYRLATLRAFDAFPMTHHVECIALLTPVADPPTAG